MSKYGSRFEISRDAPPDFGDVGKVSSYTGNTTEQIPKKTKSRRTHVGLAHIPSFCWSTGDSDEYDDQPTAPWLRLSLSAEDDYTGAECYVAVNIDVQAARRLAGALLEWADEEHAPDL